jgi:hypothetical protein
MRKEAPVNPKDENKWLSKGTKALNCQVKDGGMLFAH